VIVDADTRLVVAAARPVPSTVTPWHWAGAVRQDFGAQSPLALGAGQWHARAGPVDLLPGDAALAPETLQGEVQDAVLGVERRIRGSRPTGARLSRTCAAPAGPRVVRVSE
ncbi:hypothetical protein ACFW94_49070, partial [Streptomyces sp. NPDC059460]